jgi:hypothetical protein
VKKILLEQEAVGRNSIGDCSSVASGNECLPQPGSAAFLICLQGAGDITLVELHDLPLVEELEKKVKAVNLPGSVPMALRAGVKSKKGERTPSPDAVEGGDEARAREMGAHNPEWVIAEDVAGQTPAHLGVVGRGGRIDVMRAREEMGARLDKQRSDGAAPMHLAVIAGHATW